MDNKQESLQFKIFMDGVNLSDLHLHKKLFQTSTEKLEFINSYLTLSELEQYKYHNIGRGVGSAIRRKLINYISSLSAPDGFTEIPILSTTPYFIDINGNVVRKKDRLLLAKMLDSTGYHRVTVLHTRENGSFLDYERVHRLMALTFLPNPENKRTVNHIDGNKLNNNLSNLEWATDSENVQHAHDTGLASGSSEPRHNRRTFNETVRVEIFNSDKTISTASLARKYNLSEATVFNIRNNKHKDKL